MFFRRREQQLVEQVEQRSSDRYWSIVRGHFRKNRMAVWSLRVLFVLIFIAIFADFIANEKPIICKLDGSWQMPILKQYAIDLGFSDYTADFRTRKWLNTEQYESVIFPPITYSPKPRFPFLSAWYNLSPCSLLDLNVKYLPCSPSNINSNPLLVL